MRVREGWEGKAGSLRRAEPCCAGLCGDFGCLWLLISCVYVHFNAGMTVDVSRLVVRVVFLGRAAVSAADVLHAPARCWPSAS